MNKNEIKSVVAIAIGAAIIFIMKRFIIIPSFIPNTNFDISYAFLSLLAAIYGGVPAAIAGFIGHALMDALTYGSIWYSWVITTALVGFGFGFVTKNMNIAKGVFDKQDKIKFFIGQFIVNAIGWIVVAPVLDILIFNEPVNKVFLQGAFSAIVNGLGTGVIGIILIAAFAATRTKSSSLYQK